MIYLDTHVVVWLHDNELNRLSPLAKQLIHQQDLFISPMVALELDYLREAKRIILSSSKILDYLANTIGLSVCDKPFVDIINRARNMTWTHDPFDRIIVGHASVNQNQLLTKDKYIRTHYKLAVW